MNLLTLFMSISLCTLATSQQNPSSTSSKKSKVFYSLQGKESAVAKPSKAEEQTHEVTKSATVPETGTSILTTPTVNSSSIHPTPPKIKDILCISNFGKCLTKDNNDQCSKKNALVNGLCDEDGMMCCIDNQDVQTSWKSEDSLCGQIYGTCGSDTIKCDGKVDLAACGGPIHRKCCSPSDEEMKKWAESDTSCLQVLGKCQITSLECRGTFQNGTCGGPSMRKCCLPSVETQTEWEKHDEKCHRRWGTCQSHMKGCSGGFYQTGLCGGPDLRSCCIPSTHTINAWLPKESACTDIFGKCQHDIKPCNGTKQKDDGLCQGPSYRICCTPSDQETKSWAKDDSPCLKKNGQCQPVSSTCAGNYDTHSSCGGPDERQCCLFEANNKQNSASTDGSLSSGPLPTKVIILIVCGVVLLIATIVITVVLSKKGAFRSYKRVRDSSWYDRNGTDETVNLTSCEDEKGHYA